MTNQTRFSEVREEVKKELASIITIPFLKGAILSWGDELTDQDVLNIVKGTKQQLIDDHYKKHSIS